MSIMGKRITITLDDDIHEKLRELQAKMIQSGKSVSFSRVINEKLSKTAKKN